VRFIAWLMSYAIALAVAAWIFDDIWFTGATHPFRAEFQDKWFDWLVVSLIFGAI
jgi:putative membrane protein